MYVVVNKDLDMSAGKVAAQVAHAVARLDVEAPAEMIVLESTTEQLHNLERYLNDMGVPNSLYIDEGVNEVPPMSATALAFGLTAAGFTPDFIKDFKLYSDKYKKLLEDARQQEYYLRANLHAADQILDGYRKGLRWPWQR